MNKILRGFAIGLVLVALVFSIVLLMDGSSSSIAPGRWTAAISALPLLAVGISFLMVQPLIRPRPADLLKNLLLAATFLLWGPVQLMVQNPVAKKLGNVVVLLYVIDLTWTILVGVRPPGKRSND
jgi:peptidoglycan/LPS O-acetylase OafA/YrhL